MSPATQPSYTTAVKKFSRYYRRSPEHLGIEDVRAYQVHLVENAFAWASLNQTVSALRCFYHVTLSRKDLPERIPYARKPKTMPVVLSAAEVARLLEAVYDLVCRTALATVYATRLRTAEALSLRIAHIESRRGLIRVEQGKGRKDRYVMLSATLLAMLRASWEIARPRRWLFARPDGQGPIEATTLNKSLHARSAHRQDRSSGSSLASSTGSSSSDPACRSRPAWVHVSQIAAWKDQL